MKFRKTLQSRRDHYKKIPRKRKLIFVSGIFVAVMIAIPVATYAYYARDISDPERLMNHNNTGVVLLDKNGEVFYSRGVVKNIKRTSLQDISPYVPQALIASEDSEFYSEPGFSVKGMARAFFSNISSADLTSHGGSTITQQLVKNNLLTSKKNYLRKYQELSMAVAIDHKYSKNQILEMYLNSVYFGNDAFGIESAAELYFGKHAKDLSLAESSMLVGLLPAPSVYSPVTGDEKLAEKRQDYVLTRMVQEKYIKPSEKTTAQEQQLSYAPQEDAQTGHAQHFALMVINELNKKYGEEKITRSGFQIHTTLDLNWQKQAEAAVAKQVKNLSAYGARNGSLVAIDPKTGEIRALVGSADWHNEQYGKVNMALALRQPGSSFKPLYYTQALDDRKITAATILDDKPTDFGSGYKPKNYDGKYHGKVTARYALADSMNIPAVLVMQKVGVSQAVASAQRLGVTSVNDAQKYGLSLALGTAETRLLDMTNAYASFANQGDQYKVSSIAFIEDKFDKTIFKNRPKPHRVMSKQATYIISSILSDEKARFPLAGNKFNIGRQVAVKTGTTNDNRDAWTIGYTPQVVVGVWVGNNNNTSMRGVGGSFGAGPIWRSTITSFLKGQEKVDFVMPHGVNKTRVCSVNGAYDDYFVDGTQDDFKCGKAQTTTNQDKKHDDDEKEKQDDQKNEGSENTVPEPADQTQTDTSGGDTTTPTDGGTDSGTGTTSGDGGMGSGETTTTDTSGTGTTTTP